MTNPSPNDVEATARETAANKYGPKNVSYIRDVFLEGWDAHVAFVRELSNKVELGEEEMGYPSFTNNEMPLG